MRAPSRTPAEQLQSVSRRYALPRAWRGKSASVLRPRREAETGEAAVVRGDQARDPALQRLEAVLFLTREPLNSRKLAQYANLADGTQARTLIRRLNQFYDTAGRAFRVEEVAGGFQLLTRRKFAAWLRRLEHVPPETRLSAPALETLAVIAYRQPVPRADIEAIRGVNCGEILRQLMERDLVRIGGRSEELGRPYLYTTTKRFLQVFGLVSLDDLPRATAIRLLPVSAPPPPSSNSALAAQVATDPDDIEYKRDQA
jgi:segregation and condensation protein B